MVRVISDARFEHKAYEELAEHNLIILGGPKSNSIVEKFDQPFHFLSNNSDSSSPFEMGFRVGNCEYVGKGFGLVSLGPISREPKKNTGLLVTVAGSSIEGALNAFEIFKSNLFATNSWQHRIPEFIVSGPSYVRGRNSHMSLEGVVAAGWWGNNWEYLNKSSLALNCK